MCQASVNQEGVTWWLVRVDADPVHGPCFAPHREGEQREAEDDDDGRHHEREHEERIGHGSVAQPSFTLKFRVTERTNGVAVPFSTSGA